MKVLWKLILQLLRNPFSGGGSAAGLEVGQDGGARMQFGMWGPLSAWSGRCVPARPCEDRGGAEFLGMVEGKEEEEPGGGESKANFKRGNFILGTSGGEVQG